MKDFAQLYKKIPATEGNYQLSRLIDAYYAHDRIVIAYDIDDTVRPYFCTDCSRVVNLIKEAKELINPYFIIYTSNVDTEGVKEFLAEENLPYDAFNENPEFMKGIFDDKNKIYYNLFLDDKAGLESAVASLEQLLTLIKTGVISK